METILALGFDFSIDKLSSPLAIIGIILMLMAIFLVAGATKIDEALRRRARSKARDTQETSDDTPVGEPRAESEPIVADEDSHDRESDASPILRHRDGTINYYLIFKVVGLVLVFVSALLVIFSLK